MGAAKVRSFPPQGWRTLETALAMGFAVDEQLAALGEIPTEVWDEIGHQKRWDWEAPFLRFAEIVSRGGPTALLAERQRAIWTRALESVPEGGRVLIVSHGRVIEAGLVQCLPGSTSSAVGRPFAHGEGAALTCGAGEFTDLRLRRDQI